MNEAPTASLRVGDGIARGVAMAPGVAIALRAEVAMASKALWSVDQAALEQAAVGLGPPVAEVLGQVAARTQLLA
jgi:hypothetical protein